MATPVPVESLPPVGEVPENMFAQVIRQDRFGDPRTAFQVEDIDIPEIKPHKVLIGVMAAGINTINIWAARGSLIDLIRIHQKMGEVYTFEDIGQAHVDMEDGKVVFGNRVALDGAPEKRFGRKKAQRGPTR